MDITAISFSFHDEETKELKQEEEDGGDDEALSLSDLPINPDETLRKQSSDVQSDIFEFFYDLTSDNVMSHAEDIIFCGKLVPYKKNPPPFDDQILRSFSSEEEYSVNFSRRYCESLPELNPTRSNSSSSSSTRLTRSSRSWDGKKHRRNSSLVMKSEVSDAHRKFRNIAGKSEPPKPRWYDWVFGLPHKFPPEIDLRDMKNRQVRRNKKNLPPSAEGGGSFPADRRSYFGGFDLVSVLSCKRHSDVAVAHSIGYYDFHNNHVTIT